MSTPRGSPPASPTERKAPMRTPALLDALAERLAAGVPTVWVSVAAARGSVPRGPGARMLVDARHTAGTIGGGHLELRAIDLARAMLAEAAAGTAPVARLERLPLGASLGQCCGGVVQLAFDLVLPGQADWLEPARALARTQQDWTRLVTIGGHLVKVATARELRTDASRPTLAAVVERLLQNPADSAALTGERLPGLSHLVETFRVDELHLALFGAGHVGRALVETLARLPLRVTWIDSRESEFLAWMPDNVTAVVSDAPEDEVRTLPADSAVLIMTHSHALDLELVRAWLDRSDFRFLGLIGSKTKRASFEHKLRARGYDAARLARLVCPVGDTRVTGKEPEVIAIAIAAQLMTLRRTAAAATIKAVAAAQE